MTAVATTAAVSALLGSTSTAPPSPHQTAAAAAPPPADELLRAIATGDLSTARMLLSVDNSNLADVVYHLPLLSWAVETDHQQCAQLLLRYGASVAATDRRGFTALHRAAWKGLTDMAKVLLDEGGADVNVVCAGSNSARSTPLILAAKHRDLSMAQLLVAHGADIELRDAHGMSAMDHATLQGADAVVRYLLDRGADCHAARHYCELGVSTVTTLPQRNSFNDIVKTLCEAWSSQSAVTAS